MKLKAAQESGMTVNHVQVPSDDESGAAAGTGVRKVMELVKKANGDEGVSGMLVQLPLEGASQEDERKVVEAVSVEKDVDG
jgi:methylenetetrahydrofolate dehydrogenase (NADP+)/methenyltetrahydrofolate cyclohydrolase/formyltetrahydrofolate synthetase